MSAAELAADGACRTCAAPITWAHTRHGDRVPLDPVPVEGGNLDVEATDTGLLAYYVKADGAVRHVSHFATCPDAGVWRRR